MKLINLFHKRIVILILMLLLGIFNTVGYVYAEIFGPTGQVTDAHGTPLPGTGWNNRESADPNEAYGYIQVIYAGNNGEIDPPDTDGNTTGDDVLLETSPEGDAATAVGQGFPFGPPGQFFKDFKYSFGVGSRIYCRAWNNTSPATSTFYGDSTLYTLQNADFDGHDFGTWSTDTPVASDNNNVEVDFSASENGDGSSGNPFNNLPDAVEAVAVGGTISIKGGTSSGLLTNDIRIDKAMTIKSFGIGMASIGR